MPCQVFKILVSADLGLSALYILWSRKDLLLVETEVPILVDSLDVFTIYKKLFSQNEDFFYQS